MQDKIKAQIVDAMKAKDTIRLETLRGMSAAFTNELVAKGRKPDEKLSDEEVQTVLMRLAKQRRDSITQFRAGGREDLVSKEEAEFAVIETFLPKMMSKEEIEPIVKAKIALLGADKSKMGQLVGALMKDLKGKADGQLVKEVVESILK